MTAEPERPQAALEALWHEHRRWVAAVLLAHKPREADLEDLLQEVAMTLVARVHELRDPGALRPWLRAVALNVARMDARKVNVRRATLRPLQDEHHELADPRHERAQRAGEAGAEAHAALAAVQALPPELREPLLLRSVRGFSQKQIAAALDLPETTIETRLCRARRLLRERLAGAAPSAPGLSAPALSAPALSAADRAPRAAAGAQP